MDEFKPRDTTFLDDLMRDFSPQQEVLKFTVSGKELSFLAITDRAKLNSIRAQAQRFAADETQMKQCPNLELRSYYDTDEDTKTYSYLMAELSIEPKFEVVDFLKIAKKAALLFEMIKAAYNEAFQKACAEASKAMMDEAKND